MMMMHVRGQLGEVALLMISTILRIICLEDARVQTYFIPFLYNLFQPIKFVIFQRFQQL
uniref:Uncharacterized protein n=1 Tax=Lepeophtheirus salmonis TaxID=72036 RepID=A0A0K2V757_LEPSM